METSIYHIMTFLSGYGILEMAEKMLKMVYNRVAPPCQKKGDDIKEVDNVT